MTTNNYIFLKNNSNYDGTTYVIKDELSTVATCRVQNSSGQPESDCPGEDNGGCECDTVTAYEFWNGSNHQHIVVSAPYDAPFAVVEAAEEIERLNKILEAAKSGEWEEYGTGKRAQAVGACVSQTYYESDFALFHIDED